MPISEKTKCAMIKIHRAVNNAIYRCTNKNGPKYKDYGGRGITVHPFWVTNKRSFVKYLVTLHGWNNPNLILDRIDNNGNYEPGNLKWSTDSESLDNRRNNHTKSINKGGVYYYANNGFVRCFKRLRHAGYSFQSIADLYCINKLTVLACLGRVSTGTRLKKSTL